MDDSINTNSNSCPSVNLVNVLQNIPSGFIPPNDEFFVQVNTALLPEFKKLGVLSNREEEEVETHLDKDEIIDCNVPGCFESFHNVSFYQSHYNSAHRYICVDCKRSMPTPHLLDLHISEHHDTYFQARVDRGEAMFACYLEECKMLLMTPADRRKHCIGDHKFPSNFRFDQINDGKRGKKQKNKMDVDPQPASTSTKKKSYTFGKSSERSFNKACAKPSTKFEDMTDLMDALEE